MMENENKNVDKIIERLENGVREIFEGDNYKHYLEVMAKFHTFSSYNWQLIYEQCPKATKLAGYVQWQKDFNRHVKKGEKAIRILAPRFGKGGMRGFKEVCIFDISQTEGEALPKTGIKVKVLQGNYDYYDTLFSALEEISPLPIEFGKLASGVRGTCYFGKKIVISIGMSQIQNTKTLIHEIAHELLHNGSDKDNNTREVEAESVAFVVCNYFELDTSEYSFNYVADWSEDKQLDILRSSLETITKTANKIISDVLDYLEEDIEDIDFDEEDDEQRGEELYELGMSYYREKNYERAVECFDQAVNLGSVEATYQLGFCYEYGYGVDKNNDKAYRYMLVAANGGNKYAQYTIGFMLENRIIYDDNEDFFYWYQMSAEQNYDWGEYSLAYCYLNGIGTKEDKKKAYHYYKKLSDEGFDFAYNDLGDCYFYGWGIEKNYDEAMECYYAHYICVDCNGLENLIHLFYLGYGREKIDDDLINLFVEYAENGNIEAQCLVADCYYNGYGVDIDYTEPLSWREKATEAGNAKAQLLVAQQYFSGIGTLRDFAQAKHWYTVAAENGNIEAQYELAKLLKAGAYGIIKNLPEEPEEVSEKKSEKDVSDIADKLFGIFS